MTRKSLRLLLRLDACRAAACLGVRCRPQIVRSAPRRTRNSPGDRPRRGPDGRDQRAQQTVWLQTVRQQTVWLQTVRQQTVRQQIVPMLRTGRRTPP